MNPSSHSLQNHPLNPSIPSSLNLSSSSQTQILVDYPPKSPEELPSQAATRLLLATTTTTTPTTPTTTTTTTTTTNTTSTTITGLPARSATKDSSSTSSSSSSLISSSSLPSPVHAHHPYQYSNSIPLYLPNNRLKQPQLPPSSRPQSLTATNHHDLHLLTTFSEECKKMFYTGDQLATKNVETIIKNLPAGSKAAYTKQMAIVRSQFHRDAASSRRAEVDKLLLDTLPSSLVIKAVGNDSSLSALRSPRARQERLDRLKKFINSHCVRNMVGVHPFFNSLCAVLHLMSLPARKSGSGKRRVEWDIDLALFCETGGEPFLVDSIKFLKGVLGFEDHIKPLVASSLRSSFMSNNTFDPDEDEDGGIDMVIGHADGDDGLTLEERQELEVDESESVALQNEGPFADSSSALVEEGYGQARGLKGKATLKARDRALSDPFLDPTPLAPRLTVRQSSPRITVSPAVDEPHHQSSFTPHQQESDQTPTPTELHNPHHHVNHRRSPTQNSLDAPPPTEIRIFRSPSYLTTPELREMINLFPNFISVRTKSLKFDPTGQLDGSGMTSNEKKSSEPSGLRLNSPTGYVGHGVIRISVFEKDPGWKGSLLERIKLLLYRLFGI